MKNKNGFTLVEVIAIVIILAVIGLIAAPNITKQIENSEKETQNVLDLKIENAARLYAAKYYADKIVKGDNFTFTLEDLEKDGLLKLANGECSGFTDKNITVKIDSDMVKFDYNDVKSDSSTTCHSCTSDCLK